MSRFVRPETAKLEISDGDWLLVKKRLTAGEQRKAFARIVKRLEVGKPTELDPEATGLAKIVAYLLDWSLVDDTGAIVPVRDQPAAVVESALLALDPESFREIHDLITAHEEREAEALAQEKKRRTGAIASSATSTSAA
jgi:hypothetical protein